MSDNENVFPIAVSLEFVPELESWEVSAEWYDGGERKWSHRTNTKTLVGSRSLGAFGDLHWYPLNAEPKLPERVKCEVRRFFETLRLTM